MKLTSIKIIKCNFPKSKFVKKQKLEKTTFVVTIISDEPINEEQEEKIIDFFQEL